MNQNDAKSAIMSLRAKDELTSLNGGAEKVIKNTTMKNSGIEFPPSQSNSKPRLKVKVNK